MINVAVDEMHLSGPAAALPLFEETLVRVEKFAFGVHRWRWVNHLSACLAEALLGSGDLGAALLHAERGIEQARATGSMKYLGRCLALRGEIALREGQSAAAQSDLAEALRIGRQLGYPTLIWQAAHRLGMALGDEATRSRPARAKAEQALDMVQLAADTIQGVASRLPDPALAASLLAWSRVQAVHDDLDRLRRG